MGSTSIALTLRQHFEPKDSVVTGAVGALGYYSGLHIYDKNGLVDRLVAMRELDASDALRMSGHDKRVDEGFFLHLERRCCTALAESEIRLWWWPRYVRA